MSLSLWFFGRVCDGLFSCFCVFCWWALVVRAVSGGERIVEFLAQSVPVGCGGLWAERWYAHSYDGARLFFVVEDAWAPMRGELTNVYRSVYLER